MTKEEIVSQFYKASSPGGDLGKRDKIEAVVDWLLGAILGVIIFIAIFFAIASFAGCTAYKGGKVVDGTNLEIGMTIPGTQWTINFLSYTGGMKVGANDGCILTVSNAVDETNTYFGIVETHRSTRLAAIVEPTCRDREEEEQACESPTDASHKSE